MHKHFKNNFNYYHNISYLFVLKLWPFYFCSWCCRPRPWANLHVAINMKVSDSIITDLDVYYLSDSHLCLVVLSLPRRIKGHCGSKFMCHPLEKLIYIFII